MFEAPLPSKTGSEIFKALSNNLGTEREDQIYTFAALGQIPTFLRQWVELPVQQGDLKGTVYVLPDFFCLGTDEDYLYVPMGALNAERVGALFGARLPTVKLVNDIYAASMKLQAEPWGPPYDGSMSWTSRWPKQTAKVRKQLEAREAPLGTLVEGHLKNVVVSNKMVARKGEMLSFYGWFRADGKPIQGDSLAHGAGYCDYSHGVRYVLDEMVVEGQYLMSLDEVLQHDDYYRLISTEKFGLHTTYQAVREANQVQGIRY